MNNKDARPAHRGRDTFQKFRWPLAALTTLCRLLPTPVRRAWWSLIDNAKGRLALGIRYSLVKAEVGAIGSSVMIGPRVTLLNMRQLRLGDNVSIQSGSYLDAIGGLAIGSDVSIAHGCSILTFDHGWADASRPIRDNPIVLKPVRIEDDVWLGAGVKVLGHVRIGKRSIVGAGSVVTKDVPPGMLVAGVPAKPIKRVAG